MNKIDEYIKEIVSDSDSDSDIVGVDKNDIDTFVEGNDIIDGEKIEGTIESIFDTLKNTLNNILERNKSGKCNTIILSIKVSEGNDISMDNLSKMIDILSESGEDVDILWSMSTQKDMEPETLELILLVGFETGEKREYVDLGLPSGLKWATCNVGANTPEEYGDYFAWGETYTKKDYREDTSVTYDIEMGDISGDPDYDAATANWGDSWRMPTKDEMEELVDKCTWKWIGQNGVRGYKVTGPNGNSIFLPAAGFCIGSSHNNVGESGDYWSSTPDESNDGSAYLFYFFSGSRNVGWSRRDYGHTVRPVSE